jgi:hypothetical protein
LAAGVPALLPELPPPAAPLPLPLLVPLPLPTLPLPGDPGLVTDPSRSTPPLPMLPPTVGQPVVWAS